MDSNPEVTGLKSGSQNAGSALSGRNQWNQTLARVHAHAMTDVSLRHVVARSEASSEPVGTTWEPHGNHMGTNYV